MNDNTAIQTVIPINIETNYFHKTELEEARQRAEKAALYIESLFNVIKLSAQAFEVTGTENISRYLDDLIHLSEIGNGLARSVSDSTISFANLEMEDDLKEFAIRGNSNVAKIDS